MALFELEAATGAPTTAIIANGLGTTVAPLSPQHGGTYYNISGGTTAGSNLFHSFSSFNLGTGDTADFNVTNNISNVLARVTGGPSSIDGTITSTNIQTGQLSSVNLYLINPAGVMFTADAQVNLGGSFVVSTASFVKFNDGSSFYGDINHPIQDAGLSSSPVSTFGFLAATPASVSFTGTQLTMQPSKGLDIISGDITLDEDITTGRPTQLLAPGGALTIFSAASPGKVSFFLGSPGGGYASATNPSFGNITMSNHSSIAIDSVHGGGKVVIRGGTLVVDRSTISSANSGSNAGGKISIQADSLALQDEGTVVSSTSGSGAGGAVTVQANSASIDGAVGTLLGSDQNGDAEYAISASGIFSEASGHGDAGLMNINVAQALSITHGGQISSSTYGSGNGGDIGIQAGSLNLDGVAEDSSGNPLATNYTYGPYDYFLCSTLSPSEISVQTSGSGAAGSVNLSNIGTLSLTNGAAISSITSGSGNGGNLMVQAETISINGSSGDVVNSFYSNPPFLASISPSQISTQNNGVAQGGAIDVTAETLSLTDGGAISASTTSGGGGGNIMVTSGSATIDGGGLLSYSFPEFSSSPVFAFSPSAISSQTSGTGNGGAIQVTTSGALSLTNGGEIFTNNEEFVYYNTGGGSAGRAAINAGSLKISGATTDPNGNPYISQISSLSYGTGSGGTFNITTGAATLSNGGEILTSTQYSGGPGGSLSLRATSLSIDGVAQTSGGEAVLDSQSEPISSQISSQTDGNGDGGNLSVQVDNNLSLGHSGQINSQGSSYDTAGDLEIQAGSLTVDGSGSPSGLTGIFITLAASQTGFAYALNVNIAGATNLVSGGRIVSSTSAGVDGGSFSLTTKTLNIDNSSEIATETTGSGNAGALTVNVAQALEISSGGQILTSTSGAGSGGALMVQTDTASIDGTSLQFGTTGIVSESSGLGSPGTLTLNVAGELAINDGGEVASSTEGMGNNGSISLEAGSVTINGSTASQTDLQNGVFANPLSNQYDITLDGTLGTPEVLFGPFYTITPDMGLVMGSNLFESFGSLSLTNTEALTFSGPSTIQNIIARVTGNNVSSIDGTISSPIAGANLFFVNPAGVTLGPSSQFAINGGVTFATANIVKFSDGGVFNTTLGHQDNPTGGEVSALGFTSATTGIISVTGAQLSVPAGTNLDLIGGDVSLSGATLSAPSGGLGIFSADGAGDVPINLISPVSGFVATTVTSFGNVTLQNGTVVTIDGQGGGELALVGGVVMLDASFITSVNTGTLAGGDISVRATQLNLTDGSVIGTANNNTGSGGPITITADTLTITGSGSGIFSEVFLADQADGDGGAITLDINGALSVTQGGQIFAYSDNGNGGEIQITAGSVLLDGSLDLGAFYSGYFTTGILSESGGDAPATNGSVTMNVGGGITVLGGAEIASWSNTLATPGAISITAGSLDIDGTATIANAESTGSPLPTGIDSFDFLGGDAGSIVLNVSGAVNLVNDGAIVIGVSNFGSGLSGTLATLSLTAGSLTINGTGGYGQTGILSGDSDFLTYGAVSGGSLTINLKGALSIISGTIDDSTYNAGQGGNVLIQASSLFESQSDILSATSGSGNAGDVDLEIMGDAVLNDATIRADTYAAGNAGAVTLRAGSVNLNGSYISSETTSMGNAGQVNVIATGELNLTSGAELSTLTSGPGEAGEVSVQAGSLSIDGSATLSQFTGIDSDELAGATGNAGQVNVVIAGDATLSGEAEISSDAYSATGNAGQVSVKVADNLTIITGAGITSDTFGAGLGGDVTVTAGALTIDGNATPGNFTGINSDANSGSSGNAGLVNVTVTNDLSISGGRISSSTFGSGNAGDVSVQAGSMTIIGSHVPTLFSGIRSIAGETPGSTGSAGQVNVTVLGDLTMTSSGQISSSSFTSGNAGDVTVQAGTLGIDGSATPTLATGIESESDSSDPSSEGNAGSITVSVSGGLSLTGAGQISATTNTAGQGGDVNVNAGFIAIDGSATPGETTGITAEATAAGKGGSLTISARNIVLSGGGTVSAASTISDGGNIGISATNLSLLAGATISATAGSNGGSITIHVGSLVYVLNSQITATAGSNGGDILIDPQFVVLDNSLISANAALGQGGNMTIVADDFLNSNGLITATGTTNGTVTITAPDLNLSGSLIALPVVLENNDKRLRETCARSINHEFSSFIEVGRGGTENAPEELQPDFGFDAISQPR